MMAINKHSSYDGKTIALHWGSAALILLLWLAGQFLDIFPKGTPRITVRSMHICLGVFLGFALAYRMWWRNHGGTNFPLDGGVPHEKIAQKAHSVLYAVIGLLVVSGIALVWVRGDNLFNLVSVPAFDPANKDLRHDAKEVHGWIANALLLGASLHGVFAIWHQAVLKDNILRRMLPRI